MDPNGHQTPPSYLDNVSGAFYDPIFSGARPDLRIAHLGVVKTEEKNPSSSVFVRLGAWLAGVAGSAEA